MTGPTTYYAPAAGLPPQTRLTTDRSRFNEAYVVIPRGCLTDIVASRLPFWDDTRLWVLARPLSGFAETFSQYLVEVAPAYDLSGNTALVAANLLYEMLCILPGVEYRS